MLAQLVPQLLKITKDLIRNENNDSFLLLKELLFYKKKKKQHYQERSIWRGSLNILVIN